MNRLPISTFKNPGEDSEITKYKILGTLKEYLSNLRHNKLYPTLTELVSLSVRLENLIVHNVGPLGSPEHLFLNSDENISVLGNLDSGDGSSDDLCELIKWTRAQLNPILDEGIAVYEFVDENIDMQLINNVSNFKDNGYLIIPEHKAGRFNIYSYHCILFNTGVAPIKSIKTLFLKSLPISAEIISAQVNKLCDNIEDKNLQVYYCKTDLDFPYEDTIFQIARKKLLRLLSV